MNGVRLNYLDWSGAGEPLMLIPGQDGGLNRELLPAAEVVRRIVMEAEEILGRDGHRSSHLC